MYFNLSTRKVSNVFLNQISIFVTLNSVIPLCFKLKNKTKTTLFIFFEFILFDGTGYAPKSCSGEIDYRSSQSIFYINNLKLSISSYKIFIVLINLHHLPQVPLYYCCISLETYCVQHGCLSQVEALLIYTIALCNLVPTTCVF